MTHRFGSGIADAVAGMNPVAAAVAALVLNAALASVSIMIGARAVQLATHTRVTADPGRMTRTERALVASAVVVNATVTVGGWWLWRDGYLHLTAGVHPGTVVELAGLVMLMDLLGYLLHSLSHLRPLYPLVHRVQHRFTDPRPATLFAMHPAEVAGIGVLWAVVLTAWTVSVWTLAALVAVNLAFGTLAHLGIDPLPALLRRSPLFRWVALPTFHALHHTNPNVNRGFYTTIWDRLFGTIDPTYDQHRSQQTVHNPERHKPRRHPRPAARSTQRGDEEGPAGREQHQRAADEGQRPAVFVSVEPGGDERPELVDMADVIPSGCRHWCVIDAISRRRRAPTGTLISVWSRCCPRMTRAQTRGTGMGVRRGYTISAPAWQGVG